MDPQFLFEQVCSIGETAMRIGKERRFLPMPEGRGLCAERVMTLLQNTHAELLHRAPDWHIRPLHIHEQHLAWTLSQSAFDAPESPDQERSEMIEQLWLAWGQSWFQWLQDNGQGWAALDPATDQLVGYARVIRSVEQRIEILSECYVHASYHNNGIGSRLLAAALSPTVPVGWQRMILSTDQPSAIGLYLRYGVLPMGAVWMIAPDLSQHTIQIPQTQTMRSIDHIDAPTLAAMDRLDMLTYGWQHGTVNMLLRTAFHARVLLCEQNGAMTGYGMRHNGMLGPIVAANSDDFIALVQAHIAEMQDAREPFVGMWVHHTNYALFAWFAEQHIPIHILSQGILLASSPELPRLANVALPTPPFVP